MYLRADGQAGYWLSERIDGWRMAGLVGDGPGCKTVGPHSGGRYSRAGLFSGRHYEERSICHNILISFYCFAL